MRALADYRTLMTGLWLAASVGCGETPQRPALSTVRVNAAATPVTSPDGAPADAPTETATASSAEATPNDPFAEFKLFAFTLLQFKQMELLQDRDVQRELQLTSVQIERFAAEGKYVQAQFAALQKLPYEEKEAKVKAEFYPDAQRYQALVEKELSASQRHILFERVVRAQRGAIALILPGVPETLQLTEEQWTAICGIIDHNRKTTRVENIYNPLEIARLMQKAQASRNAAESHLTAEQREKWNALLGK